LWIVIIIWFSSSPSHGYRLTRLNNLDDNESEQLATSKRFNVHLKYPCSCPAKPTVLNFGPDAFPRLVNEVVCSDEGMSCTKGTCKEFYHRIAVIRPKKHGHHHEINNLLPYGHIRDNYTIEYKNVSVDCRCSVN